MISGQAIGSKPSQATNIPNNPVLYKRGASLKQLQVLAQRIGRFYDLLDGTSLTETYEAAHAKLALDSVSVIKTRLEMLKHNKIKPLPIRSQAAADASYLEAASKNLLWSRKGNTNSCQRCGSTKEGNLQYLATSRKQS